MYSFKILPHAMGFKKYGLLHHSIYPAFLSVVGTRCWYREGKFIINTKDGKAIEY